MTQFSGGAKAEAENSQNAGDDKNAIQDAALKGKLDEVEAGDVSSSISDFGSMIGVKVEQGCDRWANFCNPE